MSKTIVLINPQSASGKTRKRWPRVAPLVMKAIPEATLRFTQSAGEAEQLAREAIEEGATRLVAVGGDGTINEVVNGMIDHRGNPVNPEVSLGILPMGTGSDLSRSLKIPKKFEDAVKLLTAAPQAVDCGFVEVAGAGRAFINIGSLGISSEVARHFEEHGKTGIVSYVSGLLSASKRYGNRGFTVRYKDTQGEWCDRQLPRAFVLAVANGQYFGGGMHIAPDAKMNDHAFQCVLIRDLSTMEIIRYLPSLFKGAHLRHSPFTSLNTHELEIQVTQPTYIELDGEPTFELSPDRPGHLRLLPNALKVHAGLGAPGLAR